MFANSLRFFSTRITAESLLKAELLSEGAPLSQHLEEFSPGSRVIAQAGLDALKKRLSTDLLYASEFEKDVDDLNEKIQNMLAKHAKENDKGSHRHGY